MKTTHLFLMICLGLPGVCCLAASGDDKNQETLPVSVMSFNIRYATTKDGENQWVNRKALISSVIRQYSPDVIGLQEAQRGQLDDLRKALPEYNEIGVGRSGGNQGEFSAILYRRARFDVDQSGTFWLSNTPEKPSRDWGSAFNRVCTWARLTDHQANHSFYLYNTHLDHKSQAAREKGLRLIVSRIQKRTHPDPFILTGDLNAGETNPAILFLKGTGLSKDNSPLPLVDTFRVLHPNTKEVGTLNGFRGRTKGNKIDYIFVAPATQVLDASIVRTEKQGRYPSDHFPVTATLRFESGRDTNRANTKQNSE